MKQSLSDNYFGIYIAHYTIYFSNVVIPADCKEVLKKAFLRKIFSVIYFGMIL